MSTVVNGRHVDPSYLVSGYIIYFFERPAVIVNNGIVRILVLLCQNLKMDPIRNKSYGFMVFTIRNITLSLIQGCGCYIDSYHNSNSTFNVLFKIALHITYQSRVLIISYH